MKISTFSFKLIFPILLLTLIVINSCKNDAINPDDNANQLSGVLVDEQGTPVPSAVITVYNPNISLNNEIAKSNSDEDGKFSISKLPTEISSLNIKIIHPDFVSVNESLTTFKQKTKTPVKLVHHDTCKGVLYIWSYKLSDSTQLNDVVLKMFKSGTLFRKGSFIDGKLVFTNICPGDYILQYHRQNYQTSNDTITFNGSDTISIHKFFEQIEADSCCHGKITVTTKDSSNNLLSSVKCILYYGSNQIQYNYTDSLGTLTFTDLCPGDYKISLNKSGYSSTYLTFHLNCSDSVGSNVVLTQVHKTDSCCNGALKVFLIDKSTGKAPTNSITTYLMQGGSVVQSSTNSTYAYFSKLCEGTYQIKITSSNYETIIFDYTSHCNSLDSTTKYLVPTHTSDTCCHGKIDIVFKDSTTKSVLKGVVTYLYNGSTKIAAQSSDANGVVHFTGICKGDFTVKSSLSGYNSYNFTLTMDCNDSISKVVYLSKPKSNDTCCTGKLHVTVLDSTDGSPVSGATVYLMKSDGTSVSGTTDANGNYTFENLCAPVTYKVKALRSDYNYNYVPITFHTCITQSITLKILKK